MCQCHRTYERDRAPNLVQFKTIADHEMLEMLRSIITNTFVEITVSEWFIFIRDIDIPRQINILKKTHRRGQEIPNTFFYKQIKTDQPRFDRSCGKNEIIFFV